MARAKRAQLDSNWRRPIRKSRRQHRRDATPEIDAPFAGMVTAESVEPGNPGGAGRCRCSRSSGRAPIGWRPGGGIQAAADSTWPDGVGMRWTRRIARFDARVSEIVPAVDAASRAYIVKIDLPPLPDLRSGMFGRAVFPLGTRKVMAIPAAAVVDRGQLQSVFVVEDGSRANAPGDPRRGKQGQVEVLSGLSAGEQVIFPVPARAGGRRPGGGAAVSVSVAGSGRAFAHAWIASKLTPLVDRRARCCSAPLRCGNCRAKKSRRSSCR